MADRKVENVLLRQKAEPVLPIAGRAQSDEHLVTACLKVSAEVDDVAFRAGVVPGRGYVKDLHAL